MMSKKFPGNFWEFIVQNLFLINLGVFIILIIIISVLPKSVYIIPYQGVKEVNPMLGNRQVPAGPIYGIWGKVTSITITAVNKGSLQLEEGTVTVKSDYGDEYNFKVNGETLISKYLVKPEAEAPVLQEDHVPWKGLKIGDYIYFNSPEDLLKVFSPRVSTIGIYIYE
jgi:hypothetical protein